MEFRAYYKHMDSSLPLYAYAQKKLTERIEKYVRDAIECQVTFSVANNLNHVSCQVVAGGGFSVIVESDDDVSMYSCVDKLVDKLDKRLRRQKEKYRSHRGPGMKPGQAAAVAAATGPVDFEEFAAVDADSVDASYVLGYEQIVREHRAEA